jgi:CubicO group peptidase (beta-lactamase class C family)
MPMNGDIEARMKRDNLNVCILLNLFVIFLLLLLPVLKQYTSTAANKVETLEAKVDAYVKPYIEMGCFSGCMFVAKGGEVLLNKGYGMANIELAVPNTPKTRFHIASVSKPFTTTAILFLQERGLLNVEDPIIKYISDYPNGNKITIHHLMTHTSGIPNVNGFPDYDAKSKFPHSTAELVELFKDEPLMFEPGDRYGYSNSNYNLLAYIIEYVSGTSYGEFLENQLFDPVGIQDTGHHGDAGEMISNRASGYIPAGTSDLKNAPFIDWSIKTGNGSLYSTVVDLYKFDRVLYTEKLLKKATLDRMFTEHIDGVGYGWFIGKRHSRNVVRINGRSPGFNSAFQRYVDDDVCVIVLSNNYTAVASLIANDVAAIVFGEDYEIPRVIKPVKLRKEILDNYLGSYAFGNDFYVPNAEYAVEREKDYLVMRRGNWNTVLTPQSEDTFFLREFWAAVTFVKDVEGRITYLLWSDYKAKRLNDE